MTGSDVTRRLSAVTDGASMPNTAPDAALALRAFERLTRRLPGITPQWSDAGLRLVCEVPFVTEFLPSRRFADALCLLPGKCLADEAEPLLQPAILLSFEPSTPPSFTPIGSFCFWEKPVEQRTGGYALERVEDAEGLRRYQALDSSDSLVGGPFDAYTEWFLTRGDAEGKLRITDLEDGAFFLSRVGGRVSPRSLWLSAENLLARRGAERITLLAPSQDESPAEAGFVPMFSLYAQVSG